ncbi:hypothetical protein [Streptosporangium subroseum]|uniref:hypothetical protein n=1 Tax=Streptosporangium subroseum TaxID=106412 RepID=UPI00308FFF54|nr:hypothetical protein OHB15_37225 [Streptosporangium subroseum]
MKAVAAPADRGRPRAEIGTVPPEKAAQAHERGETGRIIGKIVLAVEIDAPELDRGPTARHRPSNRTFMGYM